MVRNYKRKTKNARWSENDLQAATKDIKKKTITFSKATELYKIPRSTLFRHVRNKFFNPGTKNLGRFKLALSPDFKDELVSHIKHMQKMLFGLSCDSLRKLACDVAQANGLTVPFNDDKSKAGKVWLYGFLSRHPDLSLRKPEVTSLSRATGFNKVQVELFYSKLQEILLQNNVSPSRIFNMDETVISSVQKPGKILSQREMKQVGKLTSLEKGKTTTVVCAMNSIGNYIPSMFIFPRKEWYKLYSTVLLLDQ